jgi:hypothetical protein
MTVTPAALVRLDRALLRSPVVLASGALRVESISARAGAPLIYATGVEVATEEALRDPVYLDASRGLPIVVHHPASGRSRESDGARVGTVTGARYDEETSTVVRELTITDPKTIQRVLDGELAEVSEGYSVPPSDLVVRNDGISEQRRRIPNHLALTTRDGGRLSGAIIRLDEDTMTADEIRAIIREELAAAFKMRDDAATKPKMDEDGAAPAVVAAAAADEAKRMDEAVASRVALLRRADEHGIKVPDDAKTDAQIATAIAVALGADATRCDSLDYARAWIDAAPARRADSWGDELRTDSRRSGAPTFSF